MCWSILSQAGLSFMLSYSLYMLRLHQHNVLSFFSSSAVSTQWPDVSNGALLDEQHSSVAPCTCCSSVARCVAS